MFSVKRWLRQCFYKSDPAFSRKQQFPDYCVFAGFHNLQVGRRLALEEWIHVDAAACMLIDPLIYEHVASNILIYDRSIRMLVSSSNGNLWIFTQSSSNKRHSRDLAEVEGCCWESIRIHEKTLQLIKVAEHI